METVYRVNAKSGKIVSKSGATSDRMISPDEAEKAVLADVGLKRKAVWDMTVTRVNRYSKLLYSVEYTYRGISQFGEVDVFTGEVLSSSYPPEMDLSDLDTRLTEDEVLKTALSWLGDKDYDGCRIYGNGNQGRNEQHTNSSGNAGSRWKNNIQNPCDKNGSWNHNGRYFS